MKIYNEVIHHIWYGSWCGSAIEKLSVHFSIEYLIMIWAIRIINRDIEVCEECSEWIDHDSVSRVNHISFLKEESLAISSTRRALPPVSSTTNNTYKWVIECMRLIVWKRWMCKRRCVQFASMECMYFCICSTIIKMNCVKLQRKISISYDHLIDKKHNLQQILHLHV